jgi:type IV secretion system protein VirD4
MSQNPRPQGRRSVAIYAVLLGAYLLPPLLVALPARLAGATWEGAPYAWPLTLMQEAINGGPWPLPWTWLGWGGDPRPGLFWTALALEAVPAGVAGLVALRLFRSTGAGVRRASRWARGLDLRRAGLVLRRPRPLRLILGRLPGWISRGPFIAAGPGVSILVFGPTGSGKSAGLCVPHILEWEGPVVAISIKNDLVVQTAGERQRRGRTDVFDPTGTTGLATSTWSPMARCRSFDRAMRVGQWLVQGQGRAGNGAGGTDAEWAHWEDAAIRLVSTALYAGDSLGGSIIDALSWLDDGSGTKLGLALGAIQNRDPRALQWYQSIQERPERERGSCYSTSQRTLRPYIERAVAASAVDPSFDPARFLESDNDTLYLVAPQSEQDRLSGVFASLVMTVMTDATDLAQSQPQGSLRRPLLVVLDECANTAPIPELPQYLSTVRSMGITLVAIFQDLSQCEHRYGDLAGSIVNNARAVLFLSGSKDRKTLELLRDLAGRERTRRYTVDDKGGSQVTFDKEELLSVDIGRQLGPGRAVLLLDHLSPIALRLRNCYRDPDLRARRRRFLPHVTEIVPEPPRRRAGLRIRTSPPQA